MKPETWTKTDKGFAITYKSEYGIIASIEFEINRGAKYLKEIMTDTEGFSVEQELLPIDLYRSFDEKQKLSILDFIINSCEDKLNDTNDWNDPLNHEETKEWPSILYQCMQGLEEQL